ncbi:MAG: M67 family metallopeptidase, partial [Pseudomonadota bacterium]
MKGNHCMRIGKKLSLHGALRDMMILHALQEAPNECCGVLLGKNGVVERIAAIKSNPPAPDAYYMDPVQQMGVFEEMEKQGQSLLGIYHSHPRGPVEPSGADLQLAFHPEAVYFIISLA